MDVPVVRRGQKIRGEGYEEGLEAGRCAAADPAAGRHPIPTLLHALCFWSGFLPLLALSLTNQTGPWSGTAELLTVQCPVPFSQLLPSKAQSTTAAHCPWLELHPLCRQTHPQHCSSPRHAASCNTQTGSPPVPLLHLQPPQPRLPAQRTLLMMAR